MTEYLEYWFITNECTDDEVIETAYFADELGAMMRGETIAAEMKTAVRILKELAYVVPGKE